MIANNHVISLISNHILKDIAHHPCLFCAECVTNLYLLMKDDARCIRSVLGSLMNRLGFEMFDHLFGSQCRGITQNIDDNIWIRYFDFTEKTLRQSCNG